MSGPEAAADEVVEFGWGDADKKPLSGRRKKVVQEQKKKNRAGTFESMGFEPWLVKAIRRKGYHLPTPIQRRAIPIILQGADVVGMARTGSGKTAAFVLPLLQKLQNHSVKAGAKGLILAPTRELALQTHKVVREFSRHTNLRTAVLVGGDAMEAQFAELAQNPDIIVATPGRLLHHLAEVSGFSLSSVEYCVFDEADRMFEMGFAEQIREILSQLREGRQTLLFGATLPSSLAEFASAGLSNPQLVRLDADKKLSPDLSLSFFTVRGEDKTAALLWLLREALTASSPTLVFASTRHHVEFLHNMLTQEGLQTACVFGSMDQTARKIHVAKFRAGKVGVLITTDVAARGIDIPLIDNVVNYDFPARPELFVHRCGRAARAGRAGAALSLLTRDDLPFLLDLHLYLGRQIGPAPVTPDHQQVAAAATAIRAGGMAAAATAELINQLYGHVPGLILDPLIEHVRQLIASKQDLAGAQRSLTNAYNLYLKTRPAASAESVRRAKQLPPDGPHPLLLALVQQRQGGSSKFDMQHEVSLAAFTAKLANFRPSATVLEAEIAKVRPSHVGPTMQTEAEATLRYHSNDIMNKKRATHAHIIEKERQKRQLAEQQQRRQEDLAWGTAANGSQQQQQPLKKRKQQQEEQQVPVSNGAIWGKVDKHHDPIDSGSGSSSDGSNMYGADDNASGREDLQTGWQKQQQQQHGQQQKSESKYFVLPSAVDGPLASGRYRDDGLYISHTRDGCNHTESFDCDGEAAQLQSAVLDLTGEDQAAMTAQKRQYRWDKKQKRYVNTTGDDSNSKRGVKVRKIRTEFGQMVLAGPKGKNGETGSMYRKWMKHNKLRVAVTGVQEDAAADPDLARRFDKNRQHKSFKVKGAAPVKGGELKSKQQVAKERKKKESLQQRMRERQQINATRKEGKGGRGGGGGGGRRGMNGMNAGMNNMGSVKGGGVRKLAARGRFKGGKMGTGRR